MNMMAGDTCKRRRSSPRSPSFEAASGVKNFPAKDALADKIESYSESQSREGGRQKKRKANAAKFLQRLIFCSGRTRTGPPRASILTLINCDPDACNTDYAR